MPVIISAREGLTHKTAFQSPYSDESTSLILTLSEVINNLKKRKFFLCYSGGILVKLKHNW